MDLSLLLQAVPEAIVYGNVQKDIAQLQYDSRAVGPNDLFVCIEGFVHDGHRFIAEAYRRGAVACVIEKPVDMRDYPGMTFIKVNDSRRASARLAHYFYGKPSTRLRLVGVTGTNGKTTTSFLCRQILQDKGLVGLIGTVENIIGSNRLPVERTTPEAIDLQRYLKEMVSVGSHYAVMEVSSHSLALHRVDECCFSTAVFTNISRDHLDFHGDLSRYIEAKSRLFSELLHCEQHGTSGVAIVNCDDRYWREVVRGCTGPMYSYGIDTETADIRAELVRVHEQGTNFVVRGEFGRVQLNLPLAGRFNVYNALAAFAVGLVEGIAPERMAERLERVESVKGRFQHVPHEENFTVIIDYAHTPDGLENILTTAREFARKRVIVVFGCGGDRDRGKRPIMGEIAARLADYVIVTSDNPRSEDPWKIMQEIEHGLKTQTGTTYELIVDRATAIERAIELAEPGDIILVAGKGHETVQIFQDRSVYFSDYEKAAEALQRRQSRR